jgi:hypothetical protein
MPNATTIQLELLLPIKKDSLLALREVKYATTSSKAKYPITNENKRAGDIDYFFANISTNSKAIFEDSKICFPFAAQNTKRDD